MKKFWQWRKRTASAKHTLNEQKIHLVPSGALVVLVGNPNCGKSALFNALTGSRQKVANYAGVTVERKEGRYTNAQGQAMRILDLPGAYSLYPRSPDERVTCDVLNHQIQGEKRPDLVVCVLNATNLRRGLRLVLAVKRLGLPMMVVLNMMDLARQRGQTVSAKILSARLSVHVVETIGTQSGGADALKAALDQGVSAHSGFGAQPATAAPTNDSGEWVHSDQAHIHSILHEMGLAKANAHTFSDTIDRWTLHPVFGSLILAAILFMVFQAVFSWAKLPMDLIEQGFTDLGAWVSQLLPAGVIQSFLVDGLIAGVGGVLVFLPQILILFFFILLLEESGYLPRAALMLDRVMGTVGLSGRSFIPLLSSFACAIPGIMAARTIANPRDRMVTILIAPLMTCSARLPVYALLIGAFVPDTQVAFGLGLQGVALFVLYFAGIVSAFVVAWVLSLFGSSHHRRTLMLELPDYHLPNWKSLAIGLWQRATIFISNVGGIILTLTVLMWFLASFPLPPVGATGAAIEYSFAGMLGRLLNVVFAPIGFNWQISIALVPGMAAREVLVSALGTVYALSGDDVSGSLMPVLAHQWSAATAYSLLAWFVFAPQCLATIAAMRRETGGWKIPMIALGYLFALAYLASLITYRVAVYLGA